MNDANGERPQCVVCNGEFKGFIIPYDRETLGDPSSPVIKVYEAVPFDRTECIHHLYSTYLPVIFHNEPTSFYEIKEEDSFDETFDRIKTKIEEEDAARIKMSPELTTEAVKYAEEFLEKVKPRSVKV